MLATSDTAAVVPTASPSRLDPVIFYGVFILLLFGPLAFGAVEPWSIFVLEAGAALLLLTWVIRQAISGELSIIVNPRNLSMND